MPIRVVLFIFITAQRQHTVESTEKVRHYIFKICFTWRVLC